MVTDVVGLMLNKQDTGLDDYYLTTPSDSAWV